MPNKINLHALQDSIEDTGRNIELINHLLKLNNDYLEQAIKDKDKDKCNLATDTTYILTHLINTQTEALNKIVEVLKNNND